MKNINWIQKNVEGSLLVEGIKPSKKAKEVNRKYLEGKISSEEAVKKIKEYWLGGKK